MSQKKEILFSSAYSEYEVFKEKKVKPQTFKTFKYNFSSNILSFFKDYNIYDINEKVIYKWQDEIEKKDFSNNHNKNLFIMLKNFLEYCHHKYNLDLSFMLEVAPFKKKIEQNQQDHYTLKEFNQFIKYVDDEVYKQFFIFMFYTGTRPGEAMALRFSDLKGKYISINKTMDEHGKRDIGTPKSLSSYREIVIDKKLNKSLLDLKKAYIKEYQKEEDYFIFGGLKALSPTTINRRKLEACERANLRPITLHEFRHSHATLLMNNKIQWHVISNRLGHSSTKITIDTYTHANAEQEKRVETTLNSMRFSFFNNLRLLLEKLCSILKH